MSVGHRDCVGRRVVDIRMLRMLDVLKGRNRTLVGKRPKVQEFKDTPASVTRVHKAMR